jgi:hypothetical protein
MKRDEESTEVRAIQELISRQFGSLSWSQGGAGDWKTFRSDFFPEASLYPAARPAKRQSVNEFVERLSGLANTELNAFHEAVLGTEVRIFGNVAVAVAACELTENENETNRGVEMLLLIKNGGEWQIVSQAWDTEREGRELPAYLSGSSMDR